jgi:hydroxylamine reductase (hybrid-cluster protein)
LKNDGQRFLDLMEQLAHRNIKPLQEDEYEVPSDEWDDYEEGTGSESFDEEEPNGHINELERMVEGRKMFQVFAARMFEQRVLNAYREKAAADRAAKLFEELDAEENQKKAKELAKQKKIEKEKERQRLLRLKQEKEKLAAEKKKKQEEAESARKRQEEM